MLLQAFPKNQSRFVRFTASSLLLIESAIATSVIGAIASTQPGWISFQPSFAQERPGTASTSARDLGQPLETNCQPSNPDGVPEAKPSFCGGVGGDIDEWDRIIYPIPENPNFSFQRLNDENLFDSMRSVPLNHCLPSRNRVVLFCSQPF